MDIKPFVYVALDFDGQEQNLTFARRLTGNVKGDYGFKVNLDSVMDFSQEAQSPYHFVRAVTKLGKPVFVDLKMWNGGRTMSNIVKGCADLGVTITNVYAHAGRKFFEKMLKELEGKNTRLFALTVLSHYTDEDTQRLYGKSLNDAVRMLSIEGNNYGAHGLIVPGTTLKDIQDIGLPKLVPAIRPVWCEDKKANDQEQPVTPEEAIKFGAYLQVVGSPIRKAQNPEQALEKILSIRG